MAKPYLGVDTFITMMNKFWCYVNKRTIKENVGFRPSICESSKNEKSWGNDEESSGISASYTMGGMTVAGVFNAVDSQNGTSGRDRTRKEISVAFAF